MFCHLKISVGALQGADDILLLIKFRIYVFDVGFIIMYIFFIFVKIRVTRTHHNKMKSIDTDINKQINRQRKITDISAHTSTRHK